MRPPEKEEPRGAGERARPESNSSTASSDGGVDPTLTLHLPSVQHEEALLGSCLQSEGAFEAIGIAKGIVEPRDLSSHPLEVLLARLYDLHARGIPIEATIVGGELSAFGELNIVGGALQLMRLAETVPSAANVAHYAGVVRERAERRRFVEASILAAKRASSLAVPFEETREALLRQVAPIPCRASALQMISPFTPFPLGALPEPLRGFVASSAESKGCDPACVALPILAGVAATIGSSRLVRLKPDWLEPAVVWSVVVSESGTQKSPAQDAALGRLRARQDQWWADYSAALEAHRADHRRYEQARDEHRRKKHVDPPSPPIAPTARRLLVVDITTEALAPILLANPRGLLVDRDELAGWLKSFDAYRPGKGGDAARWLELFRAGRLVVDRRHGDPPTIYVPRAAVSIAGTVQPDALRRALGQEHYADGLAARLLLAMPPRIPIRWRDATTDPGLERDVDGVFGGLLALEPENGEPVLVDLTPDAKRDFEDFVNTHGEATERLTGDLFAAARKLECYGARFSLLFHLVRAAAGDPTVGPLVDARDIASARTLVEWFHREATRVYGVLRETATQSELRELMEIVRRAGGAITPRELQRRSSRFRTSELATAALNRLAELRVGDWVPIPSGPEGGRSTRELRLRHDPSDETDGTASPRDGAAVLSVLSEPPIAANELVFDEDEEAESSP